MEIQTNHRDFLDENDLSLGIPFVSKFASNIDPNLILVDLGSKAIPMPRSDRTEISRFLSDLCKKKHDSIPLGEIFGRLEGHGIVPIQEDGTRWSGFLIGGNECGSEEARKQTCIINLAIIGEDGKWEPLKEGLVVYWCVISSYPKKRYEVVAYVS